jgi:hypothetical protein
MVARRSLIRAERSATKTKRMLLLFTIFLIGCSSASLSPTPAPASEPTSLSDTPTPAPDYATQLRNAEYRLGIVDSLRVVQLKDGKFEQGAVGGVDYVSVTMLDFVAKGSFDGRGNTEYAILVSENYGGSGSFMFLAVYVDLNGTPKFLTSRMVDDRPLINDLSVSDNNEIFLDAVTHGSQDPMCCPTLHNTRHYKVDKPGYLVMTDYITFTPDDKPRTITVESPSDGTQVFNSIQVKGNVAIAPFENNLTYRIVDIGGVELSIGSITVASSAPGAPGTFDAKIPLGNVLSGAAIRIEVQDISVEDGSLLAMDSVELVVK